MIRLPNKQEWAETLWAKRKAYKIKKKDICKQAGMSLPTLRNVLTGQGTYEQMESVQQAINELSNAKTDH